MGLFVGMAVFAPLLTPYDPLLDYRLADGDLPPTWVVQLLGQPFSPYITTPTHPLYSSGSTFNDFQIHSSPASGPISVGWNATAGYIDPSNQNQTRTGAITIAFNRQSPGPTLNDTVVKLSSHFTWPAGASFPSTFDVPYNLKVALSGGVGLSIAFYIQTPTTDPNQTCRTGLINLTFSPCVTLYNSSYIWNQTTTFNHSPSQDYLGPRFENNLSISPDYTNWQTSARLDSVIQEVGYWFGTGKLGSLYTANPPKQTFQKSGDYAFVFQVSFYDKDGTKPASAKVLLDNTYLEVKGNTWGVLGLDQTGHDLWSQLIYGSRISLIIGTVAALVAVVLGLLVGIVAGYFGGAVDQALMRLSDVLLTIPFLPLVLVLTITLATTQGRSYTTLIIALGVLGWAGIARIIRAQVLSVKELTYVEAARAVGASDGHILARHIIPNVSPLIWVNLALAVPGAIVTEAAISFLGFGDPSHVSWGIILYNAQQAGSYQLWWRFIPAGICIALVSLAFLLVGYSLDEILNPRLRAR